MIEAGKRLAGAILEQTNRDYEAAFWGWAPEDHKSPAQTIQECEDFYKTVFDEGRGEKFAKKITKFAVKKKLEEVKTFVDMAKSNCFIDISTGRGKTHKRVVIPPAIFGELVPALEALEEKLERILEQIEGETQ